MRRSTRRQKRLLRAAAATLAVAGLGSCGQLHELREKPDLGRSGARAFARVMVAHDMVSLDLARVAARRGEQASTRAMGARMVDSRTRELEQLESILERLYPSGEPRLPADLSSTSLELSRLRVSAEDLGLPPPAGFTVQARSLDLADPFDRSFADITVAQARGAIRLAVAALRTADDPELERLAASIIRVRACEIRAMNAWRRREHGLPSPAGGVPSAVPRGLRGRTPC